MSQHQTAEENHYVKVTSKYSLKCGQVKMFANDGNNIKLHL
jgi:ribosomal protein S4E